VHSTQMLRRVRHRNTTLAHIVRIDHAAQSIGSLRLPMRRSQIAAEPAAPPDLYLPAIAPDRRSTPSPGRCGQGSMSGSGVRRDKAALSSGCKSHPANAPAGSSRSSYGGDEMAEVFGMRVTNW